MGMIQFKEVDQIALSISSKNLIQWISYWITNHNHKIENIMFWKLTKSL